MAATTPSRKRDDVTSRSPKSKPKGPGSPERFNGVPRGPGRFTERELARAARAAQRTGGVASMVLNLDGSLELIFAKPEAPTTEPNPWEQDHAQDTKRSA
jgi:hypothetical protein